MKYDVPFNKPYYAGPELRYVEESIRSGHMSGDGPFTRRCHALLEESLGVGRVLLTTSCTHALEMSALLLDLQPGDEVILPSFTFVSTANAFVLRGARPVFADIRPDTLNIDERLIEKLVTPRTRAIAVVHYAGVGCEMDAIGEIAQRHRLRIVEDNAHGLFGRYRGRFLGTFGALAAQSFHETKNFSCGEGGALLVNDPQLVERAEIIREKGTNRTRFFRGQVDKYTWLTSDRATFRPTPSLGAYLLAQLEMRDESSAGGGRSGSATTCSCSTGPEAEASPRRTSRRIANSRITCTTCSFPRPNRDRRPSRPQGADILSVFHYLPLHLSDMGRRFGGESRRLPGDRGGQRSPRAPALLQLDDG